MKKQAFVNEEILRNLMTKIHQDGKQVVFGDYLESLYDPKDKKIQIRTKPTVLGEYVINHLGVNKDDLTLNTAAHEYSHSLDPILHDNIKTELAGRFHITPILQISDDFKVDITADKDLLRELIDLQSERFANTNAMADNDLVNKINKKIYLRDMIPSFATHTSRPLYQYMQAVGINSPYEALQDMKKRSPTLYNMFTQPIEPTEVLKFNSSFDIASEHPLDVLRQADAKLRDLSHDSNLMKDLQTRYFAPNTKKYFLDVIHPLKVDKDVNNLIKLIK